MGQLSNIVKFCWSVSHDEKFDNFFSFRGMFMFLWQFS